jgi:4-amino-4-deoxy-L-arabinose transferase-like glycosyltransferase
MGLGVITKGVGFLPALMCLPYLWLCLRHARDEMTWRGAALHLLGIPVMLAAIAIWVVPMVMATTQLGDAAHIAYRDNILMRQTAERYVSGVGGHSKPFYYYIVMVIPLLWFPFSILLPGLARRWIGAMKNGDRLVILVFTWSMLVLLFFSLSPGKRGVYVLPILPMLAVIAAAHLPEILALRRVRTGAWISSTIFGAVLILAAVYALAVNPDIMEKLSVEQEGSGWFVLLLGLTLLIPALIWRRSQPVKGLFVGLCLVWVLYSTWGYRLMEPLRSPREMMQEVNRITGAGSELAIVDFREQLLLFSGREVTHFGYHTGKALQQRAAAQWLSEAPQRRWVLVPLGSAHDCFDDSTAIDLDQRHRRSWYLVQFSDLLPDSGLQSRNCDWRNVIPITFRSPKVDPGWRF